MSTPAMIPIPYEKQSLESNGRTCGAACLSMAYRSFGTTVPQTEIWPLIAKANRFGQLSSTTHLMVQDALNRGLSAVALQARHPLQVLRICRASGTRAILNHRVRRESASGHYSLLVDIDNRNVVLHDPLLGEARRVSHAELMELWLAPVPESEITRGVVIALAPSRPPITSSCEFCHTQLPVAAACPRCGNPTNLRPAEVLGCIRDGCIARMWNWICCPKCDYVFNWETGRPTADAPAVRPPMPAAPSGPVRNVDLAKLFAAMDKFTGHVLSIPAAAINPDIRKQLEFVAASKEKFRAAHAAEMARRTAVVAQITTLAEKHKQQKEAQLKKMQELDAPPAPLDGNAIGRDLLRNLGILGR